MSTTRLQIPSAYRELFTPARYKAYYGGRGAGRSWSCADALLTLAGGSKPLRIMCCREVQKSLRDSAKQLLGDKIRDLQLGIYTETEYEIKGSNGSNFLFYGLRTNLDSVRSVEGVDIAWVEEARSMTRESLDVLIPTVRKPGSEIWFTWNPKFADDPVDQMFRGPNVPPDSVVKHTTYRDNPWFPEVLRKDMEWDRQRDPEKYQYVWEGGYLQHSEARVFKNWRVDTMTVPPNSRPYQGADWGFATDPSVLIRVYIIDERTLYVDAEAYGVGVEIDHLPALFAGSDKRVPPRWANPMGWRGIDTALRWPIVADSARPETISHMSRRGFQILPARKGAGSVEEGIEFLQNYDIVVNPACRHLIDELTFYSYKTDRRDPKIILPVLQDKNNHLVDALRYAVEAIRRGGTYTLDFIR